MIQINGDIYMYIYIKCYELWNILLRCQYTWSWSVESTQSQSKFQSLFKVEIDQTAFKIQCICKQARIATTIKEVSLFTG